MIDAKTLTAKLSERAADTLRELEDYIYPSSRYATTEAELLEKLKEDGANADDLDEPVHEMADGRVSVYTVERMQWLTDNLSRADQENAIACGAKTAEDIAAFCWYEAEREDIREDMDEMQRELETEEEAAI